ncbi:MAG TPA: TlpA disulfide reductase family protein [Steroidobacteraceae bacterium]|jgi:peroxiredoxin|nr:TlpA disulfide reductase family protein [Steroidobacteraceae bacterium]
MRLLLRALAIGLLVCCCMLAGFLAYRSTHRSTLVALQARLDGSMTTSGPAASPSVGGVAGGTAEAAPRAIPVPETIPDVRLPDLAGTQKSLRDYLGHPLIVNFWATWCEPCQREMPLLQQLWTQYRPEGLQIVGVAVDSRSAVQQYLRRTAVKYPLLVGEAEGTAAVERFGIEPVLPFSVFADAQGRIVAVKIGELHRAEADFIIAATRAVTDGRETLPQARAAIATELRELAIKRAKSGAGTGAT